MAESRREVPRYLKDGSRAKKNWVQRQCEVCYTWVGSTKIVVDHKEPVISVDDGFQDWNVFVARLWCDKSNLQRICHECHNAKTQSERITRLVKQYGEELDTLEGIVNCDWVAYQIDPKLLLKNINKYIAKKKTKGLEDVVQRAKTLKEKFLQKRKLHV
jgi:hypothetical protein